MRTWGSEVAAAAAKGDLPQLEVGQEFVPFLGAEVAVFLARPLGSAAGDEGPMMRDHVFGVDRLWWSQIFELSEWLSLTGLGDGREVRLGRCAAAVVGGVAGPVSAAGSLPCDGDADVDAEESGEHR